MPNEVIEAIGSAAVLLALLICTGDLVELGPSLVGCFLRWKENVALYNNMKLRRKRNKLALCITPAILLVFSRYPIWNIFENTSPLIAYCNMVIVFLAYLLLRILCRLVFCRGDYAAKEFDQQADLVVNYFIITSVVLFALFGSCRLLCVPDELVVRILLYSSAAIYCLLLVREMQVLSSMRGFLPSFLYLCALEILPTGILVASHYFL